MGKDRTGKPENEYRLGRNPARTDVPNTPELARVQRFLLRLDVELVHGPGEVEYGADELVVLCLVRNGLHYVEGFVAHYLSLGAKHLVFLDNGSSDGTVEALAGYGDGVTVLRTTLPYRRYMLAMKLYLIERFGRGRWTLSVDIDELFDYPYSDVVDLKRFLSYLSECSYTAVVAHMLDLFPEEPLSEVTHEEELRFRETNRFYEIDRVLAHDYADVGDVGNMVSNGEIGFYQNGVQKRVFGIAPLLSKHPLVFLDGKIRPMDLSDHWATNARVADLTGVLLHYKLIGSLYRLVRRELEERRYINRHGKYDKYARVLEENPSLQIAGPDSRELGSVDDLVANGFLTVSRGYMELVQRLDPGKSMEAFLSACSELRAQRARVETFRKKLYQNRQRVRALRKQVEQARGELRKLQQEVDPGEGRHLRFRFKYLVNHRHRFVYCVVPKVACTSIKAALLPLFDVDQGGYMGVDGEGLRVVKVHKLFDQSNAQTTKRGLLHGLGSSSAEYGGFFVFAFVRNPFDRLLSCYTEKIMEGARNPEDVGRRTPLAPREGETDTFYKGMPFPEFVAAAAGIPDEEADPHFRSQYLCVTDWKGDLIPDYVGRFERLKEDFAHVAAEIGAPGLELPHRLRSKNRLGEHYRDAYDEETRKLVEGRYARDLELFGYSF